MTHRLLFLPSDPAAMATYLDVDETGGVVVRSTLAPGEGVAAPATGRTILVVPGDALRIDRIPLRAHTAAQGRAAARALLEPRLARPAQLHVAIDDDAGAATRTVASVDPARLRDWLARAEALGMQPDAAVPEPLLLPPPTEDDADPVRVLDAGGRWLVRGAGLAFAASPGLAAQVLGERPRVVLEGGIESLAARALRPEVDLLQDAFAPRSERQGSTNRRLAWLLVALLASPLLLVAAQALQLELAARALESRAHALVGETLAGAAGDGGARIVGSDVDAIARQLASARRPETFVSATGALFAAVTARPGTHLAGLEYARGDRLRATLFHRGPDDIEALRGALAADGWSLVEGGGREVAGGLHTAIALEPTP